MPRKILIVDDNAMNRELLRVTLSDEYDVLEAEDGLKALSVMHRDHKMLSAVLLDLMMPVVDGYEVLRQMRDNVALAQIPVIVVTGTQDEGAQVRALGLGANDFVMKPYNMEIIRHCLHNNISLRETASIVNVMQHDKLTGIYNREAFFEKAAAAVKSAPPGYYIMACFDVDNFKVINDQFGAAEGDRILKHIGKAMRDTYEQVDGICSRISGDNFAGLYSNTPETVQFITSCRDTAFLPRDSHANMSFSVGRYVIADPTLPISAVYDRAYIAKQSVKGRYDTHMAYFDESMLDTLIREQQIISDMDTALSEHQFEVWFQPQFNHASGTLVGAEALARWRHPRRGMIPPLDFIPVFEQNGFIYELDKYVWEETCQHLRRWLDEGRDPVPVAVNISRYDVFRPDMIDVITGLVKKYAIPTELLRLEITESAFAKSTEAVIAAVKHLMECGFTMEIDDFGSGYSSLNTLKDVPADVLKLDMRFLESSDHSQRGGNILESVVRMAKWLGMSVLAEGVETMEQANYLKSIGCSYVQGFLYARPMPAKEYEKFAGELSKEGKFLTLKTVDNLNNNSFWDPKSMDTLIFNSYVGAACIFEYHQGDIELLRANDKYAQVISSAGMTVEDTLKLNWDKHLNKKTRTAIGKALKISLETGEEVTEELVLLGQHRITA